MDEFTQHTLEKEIILRGTIMTMSADMEFILLKIILYCVIEDPKEIIRKYKKMTMGEKIKLAQTDLGNHKPTEFSKYEPLLKELTEINKLRIDLAHNEILWDYANEDDSFVDFIYMDFIDNQHRVLTKRVIVSDINKTIIRFRKLLIELQELAHSIEDDFLDKHPEFKRPSIP